MATPRVWKLWSVLLSTLFLAGCSGSGDGSGSFGGLSPPPAPSTSLRAQSITTGLASPVFATAPAGDTVRLFIVQQRGLIRIFDLFARTFRGSAFLDVTGLLSTDTEQGLLGLAFDPGYVTNRQFYIFYTDVNGDIVVARYLRDATSQDLANPSSGVPLLTVAHRSFTNDNGGMLAFGPDQCLYVGIGDGGGSGDPGNNGQNPNQRLGKILRIDPNTGAACTNNGVSNPFSAGGGAPEIWSLGFHNPRRFSFDRQTGDLYIGDIGQDSREEIDVALAPNGGKVLTMDGVSRRDLSVSIRPLTATQEISRPHRCSIISMSTGLAQSLVVTSTGEPFSHHLLEPISTATSAPALSGAFASSGGRSLSKMSGRSSLPAAILRASAKTLRANSIL